jgi:hypothetical protein
MDINERKNILVTCGPGLEGYLNSETRTPSIKPSTTMFEGKIGGLSILHRRTDDG